ncbi:MAG: hypothetical protein O3A13_16065 [Proteobacteria bacterium]|nr:hypothetical protein [Pseudomonadota bacterium]MDA0995127.1 hypothetical protein [Pseudomonadota bacterium]
MRDVLIILAHVIVTVVRLMQPGGLRSVIADQMTVAIDIDVDKDSVRSVLAWPYRPDPGSGDPSWLSFLWHSKDSL